MNRTKIIWILMLIIISTTVVASPQSLTVNGVLQNATDNTTMTGTFVMNFSIYSAATGGSALFNQNMSVTTDSNGVYNAILDAVDLDFSSQYYLGVQINSDNEMLPRLNITNTPYSFTTRGLDSSISLSHNVSIDSGTLFIDSSNNRIGIGTSNPSSQLHISDAGNTVLLVEATGSNYPSLYLETGGSSNFAQIIFEDNTGDEGYIRYKHGDDYLSFGGQGTQSEMARFDNSGNFGIGTTSPTYKLEVAGNTSLNNTLYVTESGNVGIGTSSPGNKLVVSGDLNVTGTSYLGNVVINSENITTDNIISKNGNISFFNSTGSETMRIFNDGNVGIGTTSAAALLSVGGVGEAASLSVSGQSGVTNIATYRDSDGENVFKAEGTVAASSLKVYFGDMDEVGNGNYLLVDEGASKFVFNTGKIGVGTTSPTYKLEVAGNTSLNNTLYVTEAGNVGVGTSSPSVPLEVSGNIKSNDIHLYWSSNDGRANFYDTNPTLMGFIGTDASAGSALQMIAQNNKQVWILNNDNQGLKIEDGSVPNSYITAGNFGIGTTSPSYKLEVAGNVSLNNTLYVTEAGNVGIGTSSPEQALHIGDGSGHIALTIDKGSNEHARIYFDNGGSAKGELKFDSAEKLVWRNAGKDLFTILEGGDVGIGTTSPSQKLEVSNSTQGITFSPTGGDNSGPLINTTSSTNVTITSSDGSVIIKLG